MDSAKIVVTLLEKPLLY